MEDELSNVTVFAYTSYDEPNRLTIRFSTFLQPSLSVDGSDEGSVMGQRRRIAEFLTSTESRGLRIADWLNTQKTRETRDSLSVMDKAKNRVRQCRQNT